VVVIEYDPVAKKLGRIALLLLAIISDSIGMQGPNCRA
jgi:hypothetical protein